MLIKVTYVFESSGHMELTGHMELISIEGKHVANFLGKTFFMLAVSGQCLLETRVDELLPHPEAA